MPEPSFRWKCWAESVPCPQSFCLQVHALYWLEICTIIKSFCCPMRAVWSTWSKLLLIYFSFFVCVCVFASWYFFVFRRLCMGDMTLWHHGCIILLKTYKNKRCSSHRIEKIEKNHWRYHFCDLFSVSEFNIEIKKIKYSAKYLGKIKLHIKYQIIFVFLM